MKLSNLFKSASVAPKAQPTAARPVRQGPPMNFEQTKNYLASLTPAQLEHAHKAAVARATPGRIPLTILALSGMHQVAMYNGKPHVVVYDHFDNAAAFVSGRASVSNISYVVLNAEKDFKDYSKIMQGYQKKMAPKKQVNWAPSVVSRTPSPEFLQKARRKAHS